jgi:polyisoprenoid-binding protein YceI
VIARAEGARYDVSSRDSVLTFETRSTLHGLHGKATGLEGFVELGFDGDESVAADPVPKMHVEFPVEMLRSGNALQDREMWKLVDSRRFPRVSADLRDVRPGDGPGRYAAAGDVTLSGRSRRYEGEFTLDRSGDTITIEGDLSIDIRDFGLKPPNLLIVKVEPTVRVHLHLVAARAAR